MTPEKLLRDKQVLASALDYAAHDRAILAGALRGCLRSGDLQSIRVFAEAHHAADVANFVGTLTQDEIARILEAMPVAHGAKIFGYFDPPHQVDLAETMDRKVLVAMVTAMSHDERADLYNRLPLDVRNHLMPALAQAEREDIRRLAAYAEGTAGSIMTSDYATLPPHLTVAEALATLRREAPDTETIYQAYVIDDARRLLGTLSLRDLIVARDDRTVGELMVKEAIVGRSDEPKEEIARRIARYDLLALPIIGNDGILVGIVTQDDAMDVSEEDASELMYRKAGLTDLVHGTEVLRSEKLTRGGILYPIRVRLLFLLVTLIGGLLVGGLIEHFEEVLASVVAVAIFIPLIMDMGGNVGTQSTTIFARGFALGHIRLDRMPRHLFRELRIGLVMGLIIGLVGGSVAYFWQGAPNDIPQLGIAVGISLFTSVTLACGLGFLLPWIMVKLGFDHAPGADPFITTIKDFSGLAVYFLLTASLLQIG